jgi:hypothetical protein
MSGFQVKLSVGSATPCVQASGVIRPGLPQPAGGQAAGRCVYTTLADAQTVCAAYPDQCCGVVSISGTQYEPRGSATRSACFLEAASGMSAYQPNVVFDCPRSYNFTAGDGGALGTIGTMTGDTGGGGAGGVNVWQNASLIYSEASSGSNVNVNGGGAGYGGRGFGAGGGGGGLWAGVVRSSAMPVAMLCTHDTLARVAGLTVSVLRYQFWGCPFVVYAHDKAMTLAALARMASAMPSASGRRSFSPPQQQPHTPSNEPA